MDGGVALTESEFVSREQYRAWCAMQPAGRFERVEGRIVKMAAERGAHIRMKLAVAIVLRRTIRAAGLDCQALGDGAVIPTEDSDFEPDAIVNSGTPLGDDDTDAPNPVVVVEVLSPGTASVDTGRKLFGYFQVSSVAHYLIIDPLKHRIIHHHRDGSAIATHLVSAGEIAMHPPGITISVEELYEEAQR